MTDTLRSPGSYDRDTLYIDHLFIRTDNNPDTLPLSPSSLAAAGLTFDSIALSWNDNADNELGFFVERSPDGTSGWEQIGSSGPDAASFVDAGLPPGTTFFYRVQAFNFAGASEFTAIASASTTEANALHVAALESYTQSNRNRWDAFVAITVHDQNNFPVAGATVEGVWQNSSSSSCSTDDAGRCTVSNTRLKSSIASMGFSVTGITKTGYLYDASSNEDNSIVASSP